MPRDPGKVKIIFLSGINLDRKGKKAAIHAGWILFRSDSPPVS
jgi:hypothetical protein